MTETRTTQQQEAEALAELAPLECPRCQGEKRLHIDDEQPKFELNYRGPCPDCQGTGFRFWGLSRECGVLELVGQEFHFTMVDGEKKPCQTCHGTGRIPVSVETGFLWLVGQEEFHGLGKHGPAYGAIWAGVCNPDPDETPTAPLALFAAVKARLEGES